MVVFAQNMDLSTVQATRYAPQAIISRATLLRPSTPIEIPFRRKSTSPSPAFLSPIRRSASPNSDLLFEMSPLDGLAQSPLPCDSEALALSNTDGEIALPEDDSRACRASARPAHLIYLPPSFHTHRISPALEPKLDSSRDFQNNLSTRHEQPNDSHLTRTPPVIRTTAVNKINGFTPEHPFAPHERRTSNPIERPVRQYLAPSSLSATASPLSWSSPVNTGRSHAEDDDNYSLQSPSGLDFEKFLISRLERRRVRPVSAARVS